MLETKAAEEGTASALGSWGSWILTDKSRDRSCVKCVRKAETRGTKETEVGLASSLGL